MEKTPGKRTYKRRSPISARKSNTNQINDDTQSENAPSHVNESDAKQRPKSKRTTQIQNNNNTEIDTIKPKEIETSPSPRVLKLSDYSKESNWSPYVMTIDVEDDTSRQSNETLMSVSNANHDNQKEDFKPKLNVNNRYHRKHFGKIAEKVISVDELMDDWDSASEGGRSRTNRSSVDSEITIIHPNDLPDDTDCVSIISVDSKTENTEIDE